MLYPAKKDWWVACILGASGMLLIAVGMLMPILITSKAGLPNSPLPALLLGLLFVFEIALGAQILWLLVFASYEISDSDLKICFGPFRWKIPLPGIVDVVPKRSLSADWGWGLALSLDRLRIRYRKRNGKAALLPIIISPRDQTGFLRELAAARPDLKLCEEPAANLPHAYASGPRDRADVRPP